MTIKLLSLLLHCAPLAATSANIPLAHPSAHPSEANHFHSTQPKQPIPLTPPTTIHLPPPFPLATHNDYWRSLHSDIQIPPQHALYADYLYSSEGFAFRDDCEFDGEDDGLDEGDDTSSPKPTKPTPKPKPKPTPLFSWKLRTNHHPIPPPDAPTITLTAPLISLSQDGYSNYYHLLTEILPKFRFLSHLDPSGEALIALPSSQLAFVRESVEVFNRREGGRGVVWLEEGIKYRSEKGILVIEPSTVFGVMTPEAIAYVRGVVHEALDGDGVGGDSKDSSGGSKDSIGDSSGGSKDSIGDSIGDSKDSIGDSIGDSKDSKDSIGGSTSPSSSFQATTDTSHPSHPSTSTIQPSHSSQPNQSPTPTKLFFSRSDAKRKILNEHDLFTQLFLPTGFTLLHPTPLPLLQQARLARTATIIVGEHGAALTNYLFSPPGCRLVEIFQRREDGSFWVMAGVMGREGEWRGVQAVPFEEGEGMRETVVDIAVIRGQLMDLGILAGGMDGI